MTDPSDNPLLTVAQVRWFARPDGWLTVAAPAKLNLNLLVGPRGDDGYHPLDSIVSKITLYDHVRMRRRDDGQVTLAVSGPDCGPQRQNLALRAAELLAKRFGVDGLEIELEKNIAPGAGLGGGSSDAAAVLLGANRLWSLGLSDQTLLRLAAELGSDVPLFLGPRSLRMTGRGDILHAQDVAEFAALLFVPEFSCSTAAVYEALDRGKVSMGRQSETAMLVRPPSQWGPVMLNQLLAPAQDICSPLAGLRRKLMGLLDAPVQLTGSGSGVFCLYDDVSAACTAAEKLDAPLRSICRIVRQNPW